MTATAVRHHARLTGHTLSAVLIVAAAVAAGPGCAAGGSDRVPDAGGRPPVVGPAPALAAEDVELLAVALRVRLARADAGAVAYIGLPAGTDWLDPPPALLAALADLPVRLHPVSAARLPRRGERVSARVFRGIEDPATGRRAYVYFARVRERRADGRVAVDAGEECGPLSGAGGRALFERRDGRWVQVVDPNEPGEAWRS